MLADRPAESELDADHPDEPELDRRVITSPSQLRDYVLIDEAVSDVDEAGRSYTLYGVLACRNGVQGGSFRRFSEFYALHMECARSFPGLRFTLSRFVLPLLRMSPEVVESRASGLQSYLQYCFRLCEDRPMPAALTDFLQLPREVDECDEGEEAYAAYGSDEEDESPGAPPHGPDSSLHTLGLMRRHEAALSRLQARLARSLREARPGASGTPDASDAPYEDFASPSELGAELGLLLQKFGDVSEQLHVVLQDRDAFGGSPPIEQSPSARNGATPQRDSGSGWRRVSYGSEGGLAMPQRLLRIAHLSPAPAREAGGSARTTPSRSTRSSRSRLGAMDGADVALGEL